MSDNKNGPLIIGDDDRLRFAIEQHVQRRSGTVEAFSRQATTASGLKITRFDISKFLHEKKDLPDNKKSGIQKMLRDHGFWPHGLEQDLLFTGIGAFFAAEVFEVERGISFAGVYRYHQWSTRSPGEIAVAKVEICAVPDRNYLTWVETIIDQPNEATKPMTECFQGMLFRSNGEVLVAAREAVMKRPKFMLICNLETSAAENKCQWMDGILIKTSRFDTKRHQSNFVLERVTDTDSLRTGVVPPSDVSTWIRQRLTARLTPTLTLA